MWYCNSVPLLKQVLLLLHTPIHPKRGIPRKVTEHGWQVLRRWECKRHQHSPNSTTAQFQTSTDINISTKTVYQGLNGIRFPWPNSSSGGSNIQKLHFGSLFQKHCFYTVYSRDNYNSLKQNNNKKPKLALMLINLWRLHFFPTFTAKEKKKKGRWMFMDASVICGIYC